MGYEGGLCETDVNECEPNPCSSSATCVDNIGDYTCICPPAFAGKNCSKGKQGPFIS